MTSYIGKAVARFPATVIALSAATIVCFSSAQAASIPSDAGFISDQKAAAGAQESPLLVLIQDAHANDRAQRNIAAILDHLAKTEQLRLVLVEGATGDAGVEPLRRLSTASGRTSAARA